MLLLLTEPRSAVCGYTVFLMIFTLVGFKAVPVRVLIITCVAKQRGSWKKAHMTSVSGFQLCPPGKKVSKAVPFWKMQGKKYVTNEFESEIGSWFALINEAEKTNRTKLVLFLCLKFLVIKSENTFFSLSSVLA